MIEYARPTLPRLVFYDEAGVAIPYGDRWPSRVAPEEAYSVVSHPERFAPLYLVADALIEHLEAAYAVNVSDDIGHAGELLHEGVEAVRAVRVVSRNADAATLTFVYTSFPGVWVHAGLLHDFPFPDCGCDACDDDIDGVALEMERVVFAVVEGRYSEWVDEHYIGHSFGSGSGRTRRSSRHSDRIDDAARMLRPLSDGWEAWTPRVD